ncbi:hypothetical protein [Sphingomonas sp. PP-CE-1G-424]|uniref:hypothetical protein n=1 Tax=Sphingomonas sp. PP-CE-1G-424 TaxID=2135658 RepID=UPI001054F032|nr:hypothetical protein [Sphingomonas sp. PP-CE-1G-424]TCP71841.1 hypothetical protein C8J43_102926 [Sphingomonas sp. PP-CE-1G-424]
MKTKRLLRLGVRVPNEGARRLAHYIMHQPVGTLDKLMRRAGLGQVAMDRMMSEGVTPADAIGYQIYAFTGCMVSASDWDSKPEGGWFDAVAVLEPTRRAA